MGFAYTFDNDSYYNLLEKLYLNNGFIFDYDCLTKENLEQLEECLNKVIDNPILREKVSYREKGEEITCLPEQAKVVFDALFDNEDLVLYGHGGCAEEIINSGTFNCRYAELGSHFIPLDNTNESLSLLNNWPHRGASQIAIMALNVTEYNPIYKERDAISTYDTDVYSISSEYFVGYYDNEKSKFILNPNFKTIHDYDPECTLYEDNEKYYGLSLRVSDPNVREFLFILYKINCVLFFASNRNLSERGYLNVKKQIKEYMKQAWKLQQSFTDEYIEELKKADMFQEIDEIAFDGIGDDIDFSDWDFFDDEDDNSKGNVL